MNLMIKLFFSVAGGKYIFETSLPRIENPVKGFKHCCLTFTMFLFLVSTYVSCICMFEMGLNINLIRNG